MSLSTLQAQLAGLQSGGTTGSNGTKQHSDRIGRGIQYSVQHGTTTNSNPSNKTHSPTLWYESTRMAADVPLSTLQQQYDQAIHYFVVVQRHSLAPWNTLLQELSTQLASSHHHRNSSSNNTTLRHMLLIVSSFLSECAVDCSNSSSSTPTPTVSLSQPPQQQHDYYTPCGHILEYLIRQYDIHHPTISLELLLWCLLPVASTFPTLLHRCLLLGDWASMSSSYLWLRPYCIESSSSSPPSLPSRSLIAISTMKHVDVLRQVCHIARTIQSLYYYGRDQPPVGDDDDDDTFSPAASSAAVSLSSGMAHILSYTVAIIVEGLHYLQKNHSSNTSSTILENVVRTLLPTVGDMIGSSSRRHNNNHNNHPYHLTAVPQVEEFYSWGYLIATTMVETMASCLSTHVMDTLCHTMIVATCRNSSSSSEDDNDDDLHHNDRSIRQNGLLCLFSILFPNGTTNSSHNRNMNLDDDDENNIHYYIPLVVGNPLEENKNTHNTIKYIGCTSFNINIYNAMMEQPNVDTILPNVLGEVLAVSASNRPEHQQWLVLTASLVSAMMATLVHQLSQGENRTDHSTNHSVRADQHFTSTNHNISNNDNDTVAVRLIVSLLDHPLLQQLLWQTDVVARVNIVSSMTAFILRAAMNVSNQKSHGDDHEIHEDTWIHYRTILLALYQCNSVQTERGIAYALFKYQSVNAHDHQINEQQQHPYAIMKYLLRDMFPFGSENEGDSQTFISNAIDVANDNDKKGQHNANQPMDVLLPPNVAIEHPDPKIRLQAIQQYKVMIEAKARYYIQYFERLLRQFQSDASIPVQLAIGEMMVTWFEQNNDMACRDLITEENAVTTMELLLLILYQFNVNNNWTMMNDETILLQKQSITILVHVAQIVGQFGRDELILFWQLSLEGLVGMMGKNCNAAIVKHIEDAIPILFGDEDSTDRCDGFSMILDCEPFISRLLQKEDVQLPVELNDEMRGVQLNLRRHCEFKVVESFLEALSNESNMNTSEWSEQRNAYADHCVLLCLNQFRACTSDDIFSKKECDTVKTALLESWKNLLPEMDAERIPVVLTEIASTESTQLWSSISGTGFQSLVSNIVNRHGESVSPYTVIFEVIMRLHGDDNRSSFIVQKRLLSEAKKMISTTDKELTYDPWTAMIPALSLLQSGERGIRVAAANFLKELDQDVNASASTGKVGKLKSDIALLQEVCRHIPIAKSHGKLDEQNFLPSFMAKCIRESSDASALRDKILTQCLYTALSYSAVTTSKAVDIEKHRWLPLEHTIGGSITATILLDAAEIAGEVAFPLINRWKQVGRKLIDALLSGGEDRENLVSYHPHIGELTRRCGMMLKGVTVTDPIMIVSTGPISSKQGSGGRARSYSVGKMDGICLLTPYPTDMVKAIIGVLSQVEESKCSQFIASEVLQPALNSTAWGEYVFKPMDESTRLTIAAKVIEYMKSEGTNDLPIGVPLSAYDISQILTRLSNDNPQRDAIVIEYIRSNVERLSSDKDVIFLVNIMFERLKNYTSDKLDHDFETVELLIQDAVMALGSLLQLSVDSNKRNEISDPVLVSWIDVLLHLLGKDAPSKWNRILTFRSRSAVLSILSNLCSQFPKRVAASLIQAPMCIILNCPATQSIGQMASQAFSKTVPSFLQYAIEADLSMTDFLYHFVTSIQAWERAKQAIVYGELSKALSSHTIASVSMSNESNGSIGALQAFYLAFEAKNVVAVEEEVYQINFAVDLLQYCSEEDQLSSLLLLLKYSIGLLSLFHDDAQQQGLRSMDKLLPTHFDVAMIASTGTKPIKLGKNTRKVCLKTETGWKSIRTTILRILRTFSDGLMLDSTCESIESGIGEVSKLSLLLWQDLLLLQSFTHITPTSEYRDDDNAQFQEEIANLVTESREFLQGKLPSHIFLASVTALIKDGGTTEIRSHALRLLAERVLTVDPYSSEALLYIDVLPNINEVINSDVPAKESAHSDTVLIQSAMYSIDHITRQLYVPLSKNESKSLKVNYVLESLRSCSRILLHCSNQTSDIEKMSTLTGDLISTTALCCASLTRAVGVPSLSVLPNLMKALIMLLKFANNGITSGATSDTDKHIARARVTQLSVLRCLLAITETIPQFLPPYLSDLLTSSAILCQSLRSTTDDSVLTVQVTDTTDKLCSALSKNVAARIIIPATSKALQKSIQFSEIQMLLHIVDIAVDAASTATVVSHKDDVLLAITKSLQYDGPWEEYSVLVTAACNLLSTMVMKVSEIELRRIYQSLRRWCGDIRTDDPNVNAQQRYGFWTLSSRLGKELRTIFLPCLDMVAEDMIAELKIAVAILCPPRTSKVTQSSKKQKVDHATSASSSSSSPTAMSMRILQPILAMLEHCLRADAYQGGQWTRGDSNQKFEQLLDPIGKLLFSRIPLNYPVPHHITDPYRYVVEGEDSISSGSSIEEDNAAMNSSSGSVIGCLSALALVGGNEQLWKPLNQVMMEACGNDGNRSEVRRAGLLCLLELMKSLGEEYIVLLPENLPLLSELLEDTNEDVARLARDVVTQAEELLGESLEDSMR